MKQFKGHTPGSWNWIEDPSGLKTAKELISDIADDDSILYHGADWKISDANSALIASAPELLKERDALKEALLNLKMVFEGLALTHKAPETMKMVNAALAL